MGYCSDINSGKIPSGQYCKKAVQRFTNDLGRRKDEGFPYELMPELADEVIDFAERLYIPDLNKTLTLLPWMKFIYYNLFGFACKNQPDRRRFRSGYV